MGKWQVIALLSFGLGLPIFAIQIRARYGEKYELKSIDLVLLILPLLFVLLITGKLKVLDAFGVKADFSELFADAADANIKQQVTGSDSPAVDQVMNMLAMASKGGVSEIPQLIANKTEALVFRLGHGGYYGPAIQQYFDALYASSYLQFLAILDETRKLFGVYKALDLAVTFRTQGEQAYSDFSTWLNHPSDSARRSLTRMPGFISADQTLVKDSSKRDALRKMDALRVDNLPVVDQEGKFVGTVERSRLTASLILEVADRIEGAAVLAQ